MHAIIFMQTKVQKQRLVINHIALSVLDLKRSTRFYEEVMQLATIPEPFKDGKHCWFQIGDSCQLHLIEGLKEVVKQHINSHLAFTVPSIEDFAQNLSREGITYCEPEGGRLNVIHTRPDGIKQVFFQDPDGYWLEVNNDIG